jgi:hypothetical protein
VSLFCRQCGAPLLEIKDDGLCASCYMLQEHPDGLSKRKELAGIPFRDMKHLDEDDRVRELARLLKQTPKIKIGFMVDCGPQYHGKGDRIIEKLRAILPSVKLHSRLPGPVHEVETLTFTL